jgi:hypothetical protein
VQLAFALSDQPPHQAILPVQATMPAPQAMPSTGAAVTSAPEMDWSSIQLAPGETLVQPGMPGDAYSQGQSSYAHAAQGNVQHQQPRRTNSQYGMPCPSCPDRRYLLAEALYMKREDDRFFTFSDDFFLGEFDFEWGLRLTGGYIADCMDGVEFSFVGLLEWENENAHLGTLANTLNITAPLQPTILPGTFNTFYDAEQQSQRWKARYNSFETNYRDWGWDVISLLHGMRIISYDEDFLLGTRNFAGQTGSYRLDTNNFLFGVQTGIDMLYPTGPNCMVGLKGRAGGYANFADIETQAINNGTTFVDLSNDDVSLSGMLELGVFNTVQMTNCWSLRCGYEIWYLVNVATVPGNIPQVIDASLGRRLNTRDDVFFHGLTIGSEFRW